MISYTKFQEMSRKSLTSLFFMANITEVVTAAVFPPIGSKMTLIKATGTPQAREAP